MTANLARSTPPGPDHWSEDAALLRLGARGAATWKRLAALYERERVVAWEWWWKAVRELDDEGHKLTERHVCERARELQAQATERLEAVKRRQQAARERREREAPSTSNDPD